MLMTNEEHTHPLVLFFVTKKKFGYQTNSAYLKFKSKISSLLFCLSPRFYIVSTYP